MEEKYEYADVACNDSINDSYKATLMERERCIALVRKYIEGKITQWDLREMMGDGTSANLRS